MSGINDVTVSITVQQPTPKIGFGKILILGASDAGKDYTTYSNLSGVAADYGITTSEYKMAAAIFGQGDFAPPEIAIYGRKTGSGPETMAQAITKLLLKDWYFLLSTSMVPTDIQTLGDAVEADDGRQYVARTDSKVDLATIKAKKYKRTTAAYHPNAATEFMDAAWLGACASKDVGSITWKFKKLVGISPVAVDATELASIHALNANTYVTKAGDDQTSEGITVNGTYIDLVHAEDYVKANIALGVQKLLNSTDKVPYDDGGIAQVESVVRTVLQRCLTQGIIARDADGVGLYGTDFAPRIDTDAADRAARRYTRGTFWFNLAGAIHSAAIQGEIKF
ncbi:Protein of unknown function [Paenibacillus sp. UNC496MF]|uniref:DUF3383 family protein n=1 Tax=Paenibacillus sp. UNC496MF TaxID=1502753 RepID=UPI0008EA4983|nr:DUF3383 family protein [Paenibacillus sp. UNC496MF]SFJ44218.1 Protein of unknown function [Paenibacillus sp. UNC496MF]